MQAHARLILFENRSIQGPNTALFTFCYQVLHQPGSQALPSVVGVHIHSHLHHTLIDPPSRCWLQTCPPNNLALLFNDPKPASRKLLAPRLKIRHLCFKSSIACKEPEAVDLANSIPMSWPKGQNFKV